MCLKQMAPPTWMSFATAERCLTNWIGVLPEAELFRLIALNLGRTPVKEERQSFAEIITLVQGHTLMLELITRQIAAGSLSTGQALELMQENGFSRFSEEKIGNYKDGTEVYDTLSAIISALFRAAGMPSDTVCVLKILALLDVRGLETSLVQHFYPNMTDTQISSLRQEGWLYADDRIRLHPVIAETIQCWDWPQETDDLTVLGYHKQMADIYISMENTMQLHAILREAERYQQIHPRHLTRALLLDIQGIYYDTLIGGRYVPYTQEEFDLLQKQVDTMEEAMQEAELSEDPRRDTYLKKYYLDMASILIRSAPEYGQEAAELL